MVYGVGSEGFIFYPRSLQSLSTNTLSVVVQTEIRQLHQIATQLQDNNKEFQQNLREMREEMDQYHEEMMHK